jgi:hypothetical protein
MTRNKLMTASAASLLALASIIAPVMPANAQTSTTVPLVNGHASGGDSHGGASAIDRPEGTNDMADAGGSAGNGTIDHPEGVKDKADAAEPAETGDGATDTDHVQAGPGAQQEGEHEGEH